MGHRSVVMRLGPGALAATLAVCPMVHAANVNTVYSAENALYGAGYDIGKADGWIDDTLRAAVKRFQSSTQGLPATGVLDAPTLSALGVASDNASLMDGNVVATRKAAMEALGLTSYRAAEKAPEPAKRAVAKAPKAEQTEPAAPKVKKQSKPTKPKPVVAQQKVEPPAPKPAAKPKPVPAKPEPTVAVSQPDPASEPKTPVVPAAQKVSETKPVPQPEKKADAPAQINEPDSQPITVAAFNPAPGGKDKVAEQEPVKVEEMLPQESTAAGIETTEEPVQAAKAEPSSQTEKDSGNVITRVFDFLFGWMV